GAGPALPRAVWEGATAERRLSSFFAVATTAAFGSFTRRELTAAAACITYVERTQIGKRPPLSTPMREAAGATLLIDAATRANLELMRTLSGDRRGSLIAAIDRTATAAGSRLLAPRLAAPLTDPSALARPLDALEPLVGSAALRDDITRALAGPPDLPRALARLGVGRGGPRDLAAIGDVLRAARGLSDQPRRSQNPPAELAEAAE